jgi:hypothetical protein
VSSNGSGLSAGSTNGPGSSAVSTNSLVVTAPPAPVDGTVIQAIRSSANGAVADFAPHKVSFAINANTDDAIQVQLPQAFASQNPVVLSSHLVGLCYWVASGANAGQSVMIASLTDSIGQIVPPATVSYPDALGTGYDAVYNYSQSSIEQDIVIRTQLPAPESVLPAGTDESVVMLGAVTAFLDPPQPRPSPVLVDLTAANQALGVQGPDSMMAQDLLFGPMRILGAGKAFLLGSSGGPTVPTATTWVGQSGPDGQGGNCYVLDSVPYLLVKAQLAALPAGQGNGHGMFKPAKDLKTMIASARRPSPASSSAPHPMTLAKAGTRPRAGLVLDYVLTVNSLLNINFGGHTQDKSGPAAVGSSGDYWNGFYYPNQSSVTVNNLLWANSTTSGVSVTAVNAPGDWGDSAPDPMMSTYMYSSAGQTIVITLTNMPTATYDFYLYGHGPTTDNCTFQLTSGAVNWGQQSTAVTGWDTLPTWTQGDEYALFAGIPIISGQAVAITVLLNSLDYSLICGLQANGTVAVPPAIAAGGQPSSQTVAEYSTANFQVTAAGTPPLSYQWTFAGNPIAGATNAGYTITNVTTSQAGSYAVTVSNFVGTVTSTAAILTVTTGPVCVSPPSGQVGWWRAEGNANDSSGENDNGSIEGDTTYGTGEVGQAFILNNPVAQPAGTSYVMVPEATVLNVGAGPGLTVEAWICPWDVTYQHPVVEWNDGYFGMQLWLSTPIDGGGTGSLFANVKDANYLTDHPISSVPGVVGINAWQHVAVTYNQSSGIACLYYNGTNVAQSALGYITPLTAANLYFGCRPYDAGAGYMFAGGIDEVGVYNRALANTEIAAIYNAGSAGKCAGGAAPPSITVQPASTTVCQNGSATFSVTAAGTLPLSYQWYLNSSPVSGATLSSLVLNNVQTSQAGTYAVTVSNSAGSATSSAATLTVDTTPTITAQPQSQTVCAGNTVIFSVTATGGNLSYQWSLNGQYISGATSSSYTIYNVEPAAAGTYTVQVTNACTTATSAGAVLVVEAPLAITVEPASQGVAPGANVSFSATVTNALPLTYQWTCNGTNIPGATFSIYAINNVQTSAAGTYAVVVSNACGNVTSASAILTVGSLDVWVSEPAGNSITP